MDGFFLMLLNASWNAINACPVLDVSQDEHQPDSLQLHDRSKSWSVRPAYVGCGWCTLLIGKLLLQILCRGCERFEKVAPAGSMTRHIGEKAKERKGRKENRNSGIPMMETKGIHPMTAAKEKADMTKENPKRFEATSLVTALVASWFPFSSF